MQMQPDMMNPSQVLSEPFQRSTADAAGDTPAAEWRVSKEQLEAAERASLYHARTGVPSPSEPGIAAS